MIYEEKKKITDLYRRRCRQGRQDDVTGKCTDVWSPYAHAVSEKSYGRSAFDELGRKKKPPRNEIEIFHIGIVAVLELNFVVGSRRFLWRVAATGQRAAGRPRRIVVERSPSHVPAYVRYPRARVPRLKRTRVP